MKQKTMCLSISKRNERYLDLLEDYACEFTTNKAQVYSVLLGIQHLPLFRPGKSMKTIQVSTVVYEMLQELSKKARYNLKAYYEQVVRTCIHLPLNEYGTIRHSTI